MVIHQHNTLLNLTLMHLQRLFVCFAISPKNGHHESFSRISNLNTISRSCESINSYFGFSFKMSYNMEIKTTLTVGTNIEYNTSMTCFVFLGEKYNFFRGYHEILFFWIFRNLNKGAIIKLFNCMISSFQFSNIQ